MRSTDWKTTCSPGWCAAPRPGGPTSPATRTATATKWTKPPSRSWTNSTPCEPARLHPLPALADGLREAGLAREFLQALYDFLTAQGTPDRMADRAAGYEQAGELQLADEYRQLWEILVTAMEEMAWVCGDSPMDLERFASLFPLVLGEYDVGSIPVSLDRVTCGAIDRVCGGGRFKHVILLGRQRRFAAQGARERGHFER